MTLGGLAIGALTATVLAIVLQFVIQPQMSVETHHISAIEGDRFNVWYHDGSPHRDRYGELKEQLEISLDGLLERLHVEQTELPLPIDVLVHDDPGQMQYSIARRKSAMATHTFYCMIDLLAGEDPNPRLTELVLAFGWGQCYSQLLYRATLSVLAYPERGYHAAVAAAPERLRHTYQDLIRLESIGAFDKTLYQQFDSPFSASMALGSFDSISAFYRLFGSDGNPGAEDDDLAALQAASLVAHLIDCNGGVDRLTAVWGPGAAEALLEQVSCGPLEELNQSWWARASDEGTAEEGYAYYCALYRLEAGEFDTAYQIAEDWEGRELTKRESILRVRCALAVGEFGVAAKWIGQSRLSESPASEWKALFADWNRIERDGIRVFGRRSEDELGAFLAEAAAARDRIETKLGLRAEELPPWMTLFVYEDAASRDLGKSVTSTASAHQTAWHVASNDDIGSTLASTLPAYAYGISTASSQLRIGVAAAASVGEEELIAEGCNLLASSDWKSLWRLGFGGAPPSVFRTESGLMVCCLLDTYGEGMLRALWKATAQLGGGASLDKALEEVVGTSKQEIERQLLDSVLVCD